MGVVLLVRHGQASLGAADYDRLSDAGWRQARILGARLAGADLAIDRVVSGGMVRQRDTAGEVLAALGLASSSLVVDERLDEYDHVGVMERHPSKVSFATASADGEAGRELQSALEEAIARWMSGGEQGYAESHDAFIGRVLAAAGDLIAAPGATVAVTSGGVIAAFCVRTLGLPVSRWPGMARLLVNTGITKVISGRSGTNLVTINDHAHLETDRALITYR